MILIPLVEKRKSQFHREQTTDLIFMELSDLQSELSGHVESYFEYLLKIRQEPELAASGEIPIPTPKSINIDVLNELYKQVALDLTREQRLAIKRFPNRVEVIFQTAQDSYDSIVNKKTHCIQSIKNTIKLSCITIHELNSLYECRERYMESNLNSNQHVEPILKSLGYTQQDIDVSRIEETQFD